MDRRPVVPGDPSDPDFLTITAATCLQSPPIAQPSAPPDRMPKGVANYPAAAPGPSGSGSHRRQAALTGLSCTTGRYGHR